MSGGATQAATPRLRPPAPDTYPPGGARDGALSRLRRPPVRRLDPAHSGSHRAAGGSGASHRARLNCSDLPGVPTALHTSGGTGRRGPGPAAPRRQPAQPDRHAAGRGAAAHPQRPVVSGHRASVAPQRGGHRERHPSHGAAGPTGSGRDPGPHPRQPGGPRRRNRLASERGQRLRVDFQHPHRTLLPAAGSGQNSRGRGAERFFLRSIGQRFLRCLLPYDGPKQRCWAHPCSSQGQALLRDIHDQRTLYPDAAPLARWADAVHGIYDRAKAFTHSQAKRRRTDQLALERQLLALCRPFLSDPSATQAKLCRRIERHIKSLTRTGYGELFVFVAEPEVPSDNNAAELSLRHLVVSRKVSGGTRSEQGTERKMTLASIFGTWPAQGLNPLAACRQLLTSPLL